jgi:hypothetical protein
MIAGLLMSLATAAAADLEAVQDREAFAKLVSGKTLTRPLVKLSVAPDGAIKGKGATWPVTGNWRWEGGYFCRTLVWGGDDLGYNCQAVASDGTRIRFTSDKGRGDSAEFRLR